jgi:hypothetical protein
MLIVDRSDTLQPGLRQDNPIDLAVAAKGTGYSLNKFGLIDRLLSYKDAFSLNFALLFAYVLVLNREGSYVPSNNESLYLLQLAKFWNPNLLANDWTFSGPLTSHFGFNLVFGPLTLLFPLEVVGWIGRTLSWSLILVALLQFGRHFRIPLWTITGSILLWLLYRQSIVGGEWILGTFEAKCIAYGLLFFSLNGFIRQRLIWASVLLGLAFSFHPVVGLWGALAVGFTLIALRYPIAALIKSGCYTVLFALPGLIPLLMTPFRSGAESADVWRFLALVVIPYHFDPFYFAASGKHILLLAILLCFNWIHFTLDRSNHALRFLVLFQAFLGLFFGLGFFARFIDSYQFLMLMPCRLFPVLLPLCFFLHLMSALHHCSSLKAGKGLLMVGFLALAIFGNPLDLFVETVKKHYSMWTRQEEDWEKAFKWVAKNTSINSIVISPPWRGESFYLSQREQIASWWVPRFDRLTEWRERLELLAGDVSSVKPETTKARMDHMIHNYNHLRKADIESLTEKYGANYLVSSTEYNYPTLYESGTYKVYSLTRAPRLL